MDLNTFRDAATSDAGWVLNTANAINDAGWIVGDAFNTKTLQTAGYLMKVSPVPEPHAVGLTLAGIGILVATARRRRAFGAS